MSCGCNSVPGYSPCGEIPYPSVSHESVPSLISNLVLALYGGFYDPTLSTGVITKSIVNGRVVWTIPCDPQNTATITGFPRNSGEGLLCYLIRYFTSFAALEPTLVTLTGTQTLTNKTLTSPVITHPTGILPSDVGADAAGAAAAAQAASDPVGSAAAAQAAAIAASDPVGSAATAQAYAIQRANHTGTQVSSTITGVTTNSNAAAGYLGEVISSSLAVGSAVSLTSGSVTNVTSVSLTAGDWDVWGQVDFHAAASTSITALAQGASSTSATLGAQDTFSQSVFAAVVPTASNDIGLPLPVQRISLAATTTVYLVTKATFTVSTLAAYGTITARRAR